MMTNMLSKFLRAALIASIPAVMLLTVASAQTNLDVRASSGVKPEEVGGSQEALRSYLQIQEQLHDTQLAIERSRQESEAAANHGAQLLEARLSLIEKSVAAQRLEELKDLQRSNHLILVLAGVFVTIGFLVLLFTAFFQWNAVNRLAAIAATMPAGLALAPGQNPAALGMGEGQLIGSGSMEQSKINFLATIERLEKRIHEMEQGLHPSPALTEAAAFHDDPKISGQPDNNEATENGSTSVPPNSTDAIAVLLSKGQTHLTLDQSEEALACFEKVLAIDADNAEALVKKGTALERLQRLDEAITCYDRAIAMDNTMTMAYLYKGGVFNRLERYSEALECYEKALKTQEKGRSANVFIE
ncbi:MAG: hypothetical protein JWR19_4526 [Pedosphaera sp.]|nr:hypothetical protein [Pedosphaera sp.]